MTDSAIATPRQPDAASRIASLDVLRGIAILAILFMNINDMGASLAASFGDVRHIGWTRADQIAWWLREVLADGTARGLLEMLFGAGMVILTDRLATTADRSTVMRRYYVRNIVLSAFGLIHIFILLWPGDILHTYGIAALVVFLFRDLPARPMLAIGLTFAMLQLGGDGYSYVAERMESADVAAIVARQEAGQPPTKAERTTLAAAAENRAWTARHREETRATVAAEDSARAGGFMTWAAAQWKTIIDLERQGVEIVWIWEAAGTMLIGAALYKWGIVQGRRSRRFYGAMTLAGYAVGGGLRAAAAFAEMRFDDAPNIGWPTAEVARLAMTLGHLGAVHLLLSTVAGARWLRPFAAAGRTALSIYILQTLICLWAIYPPWGLALYGKQGWMALMLTALALNVVTLWAANAYLRHWRTGPVEWAWRSLIGWKLLPIRKAATTD